MNTAVVVTEDSMLAMMAGDSGVVAMMAKTAGDSSVGGHDWCGTTGLRSIVS